MKQSPREYRMAQNEVVFREYNERIQDGFDEIERLAKEDDQENMIALDDAPLLFYCECSNEDCKQRLKLKPSRYNEFHAQKNRFTTVPGHEHPEIEKIVRQEDDVSVVEKFIEPPTSATDLKDTKLKRD
jgi:hypothetical protein